MAGSRRSENREWVRAFKLIRHALTVLQSSEVQAAANRIPPEEISRIEEILADLQETVVDLERSTEERFYMN
jgi:exonuclease VII small subunit